MKAMWRVQGRTHDGTAYIFEASPSWDFAPAIKFVEVADFWSTPA